MTFFVYACHWKSISFALSITSSVVFLDSGSGSAMSNKAAWSSCESFASFYFFHEIRKNSNCDSQNHIRGTDEWCCQDGDWEATSEM